ncbi:MAG: ECF transporter S component, partial [Oscillospiraceae bacterium]|nr:ECF transporter S component [Oscillospiraceae bacterium]
MKTKHVDTKRLVLLAMLSAILLVMSFTPLGYLNIGPLAISLNMIPVAIGAIALGPGGGAFLGAVFGITSCLQCVGIGGTSAMGVALFEISPLLTILQRFVTRVLAGFLTGVVYRLLKKHLSFFTPYVAGFCAALFNTVFFMAALVLLFSHTEYLQNLIA